MLQSEGGNPSAGIRDIMVPQQGDRFTPGPRRHDTGAGMKATGIRAVFLRRVQSGVPQRRPYFGRRPKWSR